MYCIQFVNSAFSSGLIKGDSSSDRIKHDEFNLQKYAILNM